MYAYTFLRSRMLTLPPDRNSHYQPSPMFVTCPVVCLFLHLHSGPRCHDDLCRWWRIETHRWTYHVPRVSYSYFSEKRFDPHCAGLSTSDGSIDAQVVLRSEASAEAVCVLAAVQGKLQSYHILDDANVEDPISGRVMSRLGYHAASVLPITSLIFTIGILRRSWVYKHFHLLPSISPARALCHSKYSST